MNVDRDVEAITERLVINKTQKSFLLIGPRCTVTLLVRQAMRWKIFVNVSMKIL